MVAALQTTFLKSILCFPVHRSLTKTFNSVRELKIILNVLSFTHLKMEVIQSQFIKQAYYWKT